MTFIVRRLTKNGKGATTTSAGPVVDGKIRHSKSATVEENKGAPVVIRGRSTNVEETVRQNVELAKTMANKIIDGKSVETSSGGSSIRSKNMYDSILTEYIHTDIDATDAVQMGRNKDVTVNRLYRDQYYHDPIIRSAIDMMSTMPFSDFALAGAKDQKIYQKYNDSIQNMNIKPLLPQLSAEYMVHGLFVATTLFDESEGVFNGIVPQQTDYVEIAPVPIYGRDPLVTLMVGESFKDLTATDDPRMREYQDMMKKPEKGDEALRPDPIDVIYIPRRGLMRDYRGVSILRSLLPSWLLERALFRGTIDQAMKRQRSVTHLIVGDTDWTPTQEEMMNFADMLAAADLDPVGALFVTRTGVQVSDIRSANDLWKVTDLSDFFMQNKLRTLGISESFLSGDASYNSLEQSMSVFVEQMRSFRDMLSYELFYDRTFPRISAANEYQKRRYALEQAGGEDFDANQLNLFGENHRRLERADALKGMSREERNDLFIPTVHWYKRLRPEADQEYIGMLATMAENGVPIPLRIWAASAGLDLDSILNQQQDDITLRNKIKPWTKLMHPVDDGGMPGGGGEEGGGAADDLNLSMLTASEMHPASRIRPRGIMENAKAIDPDLYGVRNMAGTKRHIFTAKGAKIMEERVNKQIAEVASKVNANINRLEKRLDEQFHDLHSTKKIYT